VENGVMLEFFVSFHLEKNKDIKEALINPVKLGSIISGGFP
jgi:hypothetical protein